MTSTRTRTIIPDGMHGCGARRPDVKRRAEIEKRYCHVGLDLRILLLDEATNALNAESEGVVHTALDQAALGCLTLIVDHCLSTICYARLITVFHNGQVARSKSMRNFCGG
ncbi:hypothetical protein GOP47_0007177 [Adiantum capillus-veneris]|uniref:Uncharacterized protein n=1 Tax=Adiantum capillus-veneris TaxID=13818 RepID=A0A9D4V0E4_ADICA|nr:hypothetical protein GOP47_0007177 [Adiantum capillus-veneris]